MARKHNDPTQLSRQQSDELMLADMVYGPHPVSKDIATYLQKGQQAPDALHRVYSHHHTDITNTAEQGDVIGRMNKYLGKVK